MPLRGSFDDLPAELVVNILRDIPDIASLDNIVRASPHAWRCFSHYGLEITEQVLDADPMHFHIRDVIRTVAYVREGYLPVSCLAEFQRRVACEPIKHGEVTDDGTDTDDDEPAIKDIFCPTEFPKSISPGALRGILSTSRWINFHSLECLKFYISRFRSLRPKRAVVPEFDEYRRSMALLHCAPRRIIITAPLPNPEPAWTWTEEQLVIRAFWRTQLISNLRRAHRDGIVTGWPKVDVQVLAEAGIAELYRMSYILGYYGGSQLTEHSLVLNVAEYLEQECLPVMPSSWSRSSPAPEARDGEQQALMKHWNPGLESFSRLFIGTRQRDRMEFDFWRNSGFAIWSEKRLRQHGFGTSKNRIFLEADLAAWKSVVPPGQMLRLIQ